MSFNNVRVPRAMKFARGTVWWCKDDSLKVTEVGVQHGTRPALIISNNERGSNKSVEVLKLTTAEKAGETCKGINIPCFINGVNNYILCSQHFTVSQDSLTEFMCILPDETMREVEYGMLRAQGMGHLIGMQNSYLDLKKTIKELVDARLAPYMKPPQEPAPEVNVIAGVINGLNAMLEEAEARLKKEMADLHREDEVDSTVEGGTPGRKVLTEPYRHDGDSRQRQGFRRGNPHSVAPSTPAPTDGDTPGEKTKSGRRKWTLELAQQFIEDRSTMPISEVSKKWGFKDNKNCSQMTYVVCQKFGLEMKNKR